MIATVLLFASTLHAQTTMEPRIGSETLPAGSLMQIKLDMTSPHPIISGRQRLALDEFAFDDVEGVSIFSPAGDAYGVAVVLNRVFTASIVSPQNSFGTQLDYPYLVIATKIKPGLATGRVFPINFDSSTTFTDPSGVPYIITAPKSGSLTIGGSVSISNVIPGGGLLAAGSTVRLLGTGFSTDTNLTVQEAVISNITVVSPNEITFRVDAPIDLTGKRIRARNKDNSDVTYFSYLRPVAIGASTSVLMNACHPVYANQSSTSAALSIPAAPTRGFIGVALQNSTFNSSTVELELVSSSGVSLGRSSVTMGAGTRYLRTLTELFSVDPGPNSVVRMTATGAPVQILGIRGDDSTLTATAFAAGAATGVTLRATPTPLLFQHTAGNPAPAGQSISITSSGAAANFSATSSANWLTLSPSSGTTGSSITANVNPAGFANGQQLTATITFTSATAPPVQIPVTLNVGATAPGAAGNTSPTPGQTGVSTGVSLAWTAASGATSYDVYFGTTNPPGLLTNTAGLSAVPGTLLAGQTYFWQVVAKNAFGSTASPIWQFTTAPAVAATGTLFVPVNPCRLVDTRLATGAFGGPILAKNGTRTFDLKSHPCLAGADPLAYSLNITVVPPGPLGYLTLWSAGSAQPTVSTLNSLDGRVKANAAIVAAGTNRAVSMFVTDDTHVIIDINGYFVASPASNGLAFYPVTPCRVSDTRNTTGALGGPALIPQQTRDIPVLSSNCGVPSSAQAYSLNTTVVPKGPFGFLTVWPRGQSQPLVSTLNAVTGTVTANAAIVRAGTAGDISVYATEAADLIVDINGYFAPPGATGALLFNPVSPCRILDTRFDLPILPTAVSRDVAVPICGSAVANARAYSLSATVLPQGVFGFLAIWPQGQTQPVVSTLNAVDGALTSNLAIVPTATPGGAVTVFGSNSAHLILDLSGYFAP